jgi:uncharacterized membrane protein YphA (DoxX/SURF4 family)
MNGTEASVWRRTVAAWLPVLVRWLLGTCFVYMGLNKALHPEDFLKLVRQYDLVEGYVLLNLIAAVLPWFEVFCGLLLVTGVAVRGSALMLVLMLVPFTFIVIRRALAIQTATGLAFCVIKFDCGCGTGEVLICRKIAENTAMVLLALALLRSRTGRFSLRHCLAGRD